MLEQLIQQPVVRPAGTYLQAFIVITCILLWIYRGVAVQFNSNVGKGPCAQRADDASEAILDVVFLLYHGLRTGKTPRLQLIWVDTGSDGKPFQQWIKQHLDVRLEVVKHRWTGIRGVWVPAGVVIDWDKVLPKGFHVLPRR